MLSERSDAHPAAGEINQAKFIFNVVDEPLFRGIPFPCLCLAKTYRLTKRFPAEDQRIICVFYRSFL